MEAPIIIKCRYLNLSIDDIESRCLFENDEAAVAGAIILLAASVFHFRIITIPELKAYLRGRGVEVPGVED